MEHLHPLQKHQLHPSSALDSCADQFLTGRMQPDLQNIFRRSQEHLKDIIEVLREGTDDRARGQ